MRRLKRFIRHYSWAHLIALGVLALFVLVGATDSQPLQLLRFKVFDAFRPAEAQWVLWNHTPDADFLADPRRGSPHSRGVAVDVTLIDGSGRELDMGSPVDGAGPLARHGCTKISPACMRNRLILLGLMASAGWDHYLNEWWHYQLFQPRRYVLLGDSAAGTAMMTPESIVQAAATRDTGSHG